MRSDDDMEIELLAGCWTTAGDAGPSLGDERSPHDIVDRIRIAAEGGFRGFGFVAADLLRTREDMGLSALKTVLNDNGINRVEVEFLGDWWATGADRERSDATRAFLLGAAEELEAHHIKVGGEFQTTTIDMEHMANEFGDLCAMAQAAGTRVALEFMPFTNIPNLEVGLELINKTDHAYGGLMVDIWHVVRSGTSLASLREIPLSRIFGVELNDANLEPVGDLFEDTIMRRVPCGDGQLDVQGFVEAMWATGYREHWGVEIIGEAYRHQPIEESIPYAFLTSRRQLDFLE